MKLHYLLITLLAVTSAFAQEKPQPQPTPFPGIPAGTNTATYPIFRSDWITRVLATNAKAHAADCTVDLIFDGDSITDFWQRTGATVWAERYGNRNAFDFGISGDRTENVLWRLSQGQVDGLHPKLIALMIGTNNLGKNNEKQIADGIKAVVAEYQKRCPQAVILLQAIFPRSEKSDGPFRSSIKIINESLSKLGDGKKVIYLDFGDKFLTPDGTMSKEVMHDFLHPSAAGYQIWADAIQPIIDKYVPAAPVAPTAKP